jgi:hypothetical protein
MDIGEVRIESRDVRGGAIQSYKFRHGDST